MTEKVTESFSKNDVELLKREVMYQGIFRLVKLHVRHRTFDGGWSNTFTREILERKSAVAILPYDPVLEQVVLIEQFRAGALADPQGPWLLEIVAGIYNGNEKPREVAIREAEEEAGCKILDIYPISEYFVSPGGATEYLHLFIGRIDASEIGGIHGLSDENEDIRAFSLPIDEAFTLLQEGKIKTSPAIISLQWLQLNREWLRQLWQTKENQK
jgi:ADP-ribose pyrophosphatase